ncbi:hypothetical protein NEOKW01_1789 [Nematocida sp. AWRm80]|nr:hypothetical protein NEOKW01_1789 [Nematocida sp. AWRm80]
MFVRYLKGRLDCLVIVCILVVNCLGAVPYNDNLNMFNVAANNEALMEKPESFLSVLEKMLRKYPGFKAKMHMMLNKNLDPVTNMINSTGTEFGAVGDSAPNPYDIYFKFKGIIDADQMLKEDMKSLLRKVQSYVEILKLKKKGWISTIRDLRNDLKALRERKARSRDEVSSTQIESQFAVKYKQALEYHKALGHAQEWERDLNNLLGELFP